MIFLIFPNGRGVTAAATGDTCTGQARIDRPAGAGRGWPRQSTATARPGAPEQATEPLLDGGYARDEGERARYLAELLEVYRGAGADSAFWFTFARFGLPRSEDPRRDPDLASYGVAAILDDNGTDRRPKESFHALAAAYSAAE